MQTFQFRSTSLLHYTVILAAGICLMSFLIVDLNLHTKGYPYLFVLVVIMVSLVYLIADKNSKQVVTIGMNASCLHVSWDRLPAYIMRENKMILWSQIQDYRHQAGEDQDVFEIMLVNSEKLTFFISHSKEQKDTLHGFYVQFARILHQLENDQVIQLEQALSNLPKNFYQTKLGIAIAVLVGIFAVLFLLYVLNASRLPFTWRTVCVVLGAAICYIQLVWLYNKKRAPAL